MLSYDETKLQNSKNVGTPLFEQSTRSSACCNTVRAARAPSPRDTAPLALTVPRHAITPISLICSYRPLVCANCWFTQKPFSARRHAGFRLPTSVYARIIINRFVTDVMVRYVDHASITRQIRLSKYCMTTTRLDGVEVV